MMVEGLSVSCHAGRGAVSQGLPLNRHFAGELQPKRQDQMPGGHSY